LAAADVFGRPWGVTAPGLFPLGGDTVTAHQQVGQLAALGCGWGWFACEPVAQVIAATGCVILAAQILEDLGRRAGLGGAGQPAA
jgi:hypothetical protein